MDKLLLLLGLLILILIIKQLLESKFFVNMQNSLHNTLFANSGTGLGNTLFANSGTGLGNTLFANSGTGLGNTNNCTGNKINDIYKIRSIDKMHKMDEMHNIDEIHKMENEKTIFQKQLDAITVKTQHKINKAVEQGFIESFKNANSNTVTNTNTNTNTNTGIDTGTDTGTDNGIDTVSTDKGYNYITSYLNKSDSIIQLFYKPDCKYCANFMPTWNKIINNLPNNAIYKEIDCNKDLKMVNENKITSVPTIILLVNNEKKQYMGNRSYKDIDTFLKNNGVNLVQRQFEDFNNGYSNTPEPTAILNPHCPPATFDKQVDLTSDTYMYQIFNSDGEYGYAVGGYNSDKLLSPFMAAYSTVDSYLSSLPSDENNTQSSNKHINECAQLYAENIVNFGLCDTDQLNNVLNYEKNVANGSSASRVNNTDYSNNVNIVNAIKNACNL